MLILLLRTFKDIFPYFFPLNNECAQCSFSARHFPSIVDGWLSSHVNVSGAHYLHFYHSNDNRMTTTQRGGHRTTTWNEYDPTTTTWHSDNPTTSDRMMTT
ncbi:uncharacterized protein LACBIDRAFT_307772 [Laccaria bicolor S238N-H82]|uniref:Predicted protein n=1 Tax=Laccaria bicolor (strain S238N-H82 / ATCC MYA-4686) TaxID=486041 RepID=B0DR04_LACBS|nr:uncharacterized protein LACBIDRAFT_307772 [Laccaria bicolor S238N-H82]EDR02913.1 predicted protein [Laccaria bicolor S238N-H82]|eukprot:XP_001886336.1 predicted protein [Laccaria bicolor S238N-H82]